MLVGNNIVLEEIDRENINILRKWRNEPKVRKYFRAHKDISEDMQSEWYSSIGNNSHPNHVYFQIMLCEHTATIKNIVGVCNLSYIDWHIRSAEAAIYVAKSSGKGIGTEALQLMCRYGFDELNLHKIWCEIFDNNQKSLHLFKKIGFVEEGILRDNYFSEGKYGNSYRLSLFKNELK